MDISHNGLSGAVLRAVMFSSRVRGFSQFLHLHPEKGPKNPHDWRIYAQHNETI